MTTVNMPSSLGASGRTYSDSTGVGGMAEGGHRTWFFPLIQDVVAVASSAKSSAQSAQDAANTALNAPGTQATTNTSITPAAGSKAVVLNEFGKAFVQTLPVRIASRANAANYIEGPITSFSGTNMTINATAYGGTGPFTDGTITPALGGGVPPSRQVLAGGIATGGGALTGNVTITVTKATALEIMAGTRTDVVMTPGDSVTALDAVTLTCGANITTSGDAGLDMAKFTNGKVTVTQDTVLPNPTNHKRGMTGRIVLTQDGTGGRKLTSWGTYYRCIGGRPTLSTAAGAVDIFEYDVVADDYIVIGFIKNPSN